MDETKQQSHFIVASYYAPAVGNNSEELGSIICKDDSNKFSPQFKRWVEGWLLRYHDNIDSTSKYLAENLNLFSGDPVGCSQRKISVELEYNTNLSYWLSLGGTYICFKHKDDFITFRIQRIGEDML